MKRLATTLLALTFVLGAVARAEDATYRVNLQKLDVVEGALPDGPWSNDWRDSRRMREPRVVLDPPAEGYLSATSWELQNRLQNSALADVWLVVRAPRGEAVTGLLALPSEDWASMVRVRFRIDPADAVTVPESEFVDAQAEHYRALLRSRAPGSAWFRYRLEAIDRPLVPAETQQWTRDQSMDDTIAFFSGGRAVGENLQLDRLIPLPDTRDSSKLPVALSDIEGITTRELDWKPYLEGVETVPDPLAGAVPHDQYAVFFKDFPALVAVADAAVENGALALHVTEARSENALTRERYERQLGVSLDGLVRALGPTLVRSVVLTGSDPYFRTGTDMALVFEPVDAAALVTLLGSRIQAAMGDLRPESADGAQVWRTADRERSSYLARVGDTVVLANSPAQLERLRAVADGTVAAMGALDEYRFFRGRYPAGADGESAMILLTDAAIRKWCGPRWRIAASRRVRALARLADDHARYADQILQDGARVVLPPQPGLGERVIEDGRVFSPAYGTLDFLKPIAEMSFTHVAAEEASLYERWRDGYQSNFSNYFDPVAFRLSVADGRLAADATVMPLIGDSDYREFVDLARGGAIAPGSGDRHPGRLLHWALALDRNSRLFKESSNWLRTMAGLGGSPFDWLGDSVSLQVERTAFFDDLRAAGDVEEFMRKNWPRLPVVVRAEVVNPMKATLFMTAIRTFIDQAAPKMTVWETLEHAGQPYVRIGPSENARHFDPETMDQFAVYYALRPDSLTIALDEDLLKQALERMAARDDDAVPDPEPGPPLLGKHLCMQVDLELPEVLMSVQDSELDYVKRLQETCWANLAVLDEYRRAWPDRDPMAVHEALFGTRLVCPAGGEYRWNEAWKTMESTALGHPGEPKVPDPLPVPFGGWKNGNFGLTFEADGLRARGELTR